MTDYPEPTPSSIDAAKQAQKLERAAVTLQTGIVIREDGTLSVKREQAEKRPTA